MIKANHGSYIQSFKATLGNKPTQYYVNCQTKVYCTSRPSGDSLRYSLTSLLFSITLIPIMSILSQEYCRPQKKVIEKIMNSVMPYASSLKLMQHTCTFVKVISKTVFLRYDISRSMRMFLQMDGNVLESSQTVENVLRLSRITQYIFMTMYYMYQSG